MAEGLASWRWREGLAGASHTKDFVFMLRVLQALGLLSEASDLVGGRHCSGVWETGVWGPSRWEMA